MAGSTPAARRPSIDTSVRAINSTPIELDATPTTTSPVAHHEQLRGLRSPEEMNGCEDDKQRAKMLEKRSRDPAVLVDIPTEPGPEALEVAESSCTDSESSSSK